MGHEWRMVSGEPRVANLPRPPGGQVRALPNPPGQGPDRPPMSLAAHDSVGMGGIAAYLPSTVPPQTPVALAHHCGRTRSPRRPAATPLACTARASQASRQFRARMGPRPTYGDPPVGRGPSPPTADRGKRSKRASAVLSPPLERRSQGGPRTTAGVSVERTVVASRNGLPGRTARVRRAEGSRCRTPVNPQAGQREPRSRGLPAGPLRSPIGGGGRGVTPRLSRRARRRPR